MHSSARHEIPGNFYWALNEVADHWQEFRYPAPDGEAKRLGAGEFAVYHLLCRWANNETRQCKSYQSILCRWLDLSPKTLRRYLRNLEGAKLISTKRGYINLDAGVSVPSAFTLLDIGEALQHGNRLSEESVPEEMPVNPVEEMPTPLGEMPTPLGNSSTPQGKMPTPLGNSPTPQGKIPHIQRLSKDFNKTKKTVCCVTRNDTPFSSLGKDGNSGVSPRGVP
ncbi:MAG: helix-turn-helix domain-containing protein [Armatimonadota bacterium]